MLPVVKHLLDLQSMDLRLAAIRTRLESYPKKLAQVEAALTAARGEVEKSKAAQTTALKDRKRYELDVEQWKEKARKYRDQMYEVKTNDAYKALQHEVQMAEAEMAKAEDRLLEQMVASEEYDRRIKTADKTLAEVTETARAERAMLEAEKAGAEKDFAALNAERQKLVAEVPEDLLDHYHRIARKHNGVALAEIRDETCTQCGVRVRPHVFQELRQGGNTELFHCETCTRILYYIEPPAAPPAAPPPPAHSAIESSES
jgi:hypothetical protein